MGNTPNPNQTLLQGRNQSTPDVAPAPLAANNSGISFSFQGVQPPSILYVNVDDKLVISAASSQTNEIVTINVRLLLPTGRMEDMQFQIRPGSTRVVLSQSNGLAEGYLVSLSASAAVALTRGQTFVRVSLQRAASGAGNPATMLLADYVTTQSVPGYPNGRILSPTEGPGSIYAFTVTNPAVGADWTQAVPTNTRWKVRSIFAQLATSAVVGNRAVTLTLTMNGKLVYIAGPLAAVTASLFADIIGAGFTPYADFAASNFHIPLPPDLIIGSIAGFVSSIASNTAGLLAGDQWQAINVFVEEWLDNI